MSNDASSPADQATQPKPLKFLFHHRIASRDGQSVHMDEIIIALGKLGHDVELVGPERTAEASFGDDGGLIAKLKKNLPKAIYEVLEFGYNVVVWKRLKKALKEYQPDVVYERYNLFMIAGVWWAKRKGYRVLLEVNAPLFEERLVNDGLGLKKLAKWTEDYCWRNANVVLPVTDVLADYVREAGVPEERICIIPNGINDERFGNTPSTTDAKTNLGLPDSTVLGFTGFIREWNKLENIIDLIADEPSLKDVFFLIVGDGPVRDFLNDYAEKHGVANRFKITGVVGRDEIANYVAAFDIALQPGVTRYASPLKMFEYMFLGKAIIAPDQANIREILEHEKDALLFDASNKNAMHEALLKLAENPELRTRLGQAARQTIDDKSFKWLENAKKIASLSRD